eukprot:scaffold676_cov316-Pavlova_lutheri.AAC.43
MSERRKQKGAEGMADEVEGKAIGDASRMEVVEVQGISSALGAVHEEQSGRGLEEKKQSSSFRDSGTYHAFFSKVRLHLKVLDGKIRVILEVQYFEGDANESSAPDKSPNNNPGGKQLQHARDALLAQLVDLSDQVESRITKKKEELLSAKKMRENTGVQLYTQQGRLKLLQHKCSDLSIQIQKLTENDEQDRKCVSNLIAECMGSRAELNGELEMLKENQGELQLLEAGIFQMDNERRALKEQLETAKLSACAAGKVVSTLESQHLDCNYFLEERIRKLVNVEEEVQTQQHMIEAQRLEIQIASDAMNELNRQISRVLHQKKQLADHWRATMIATELQSKELPQARQDLQNAVDERRCLQGEASGLEAALLMSKSDKAQLDVLLDRDKAKLSESRRKLEVLKGQLIKLESDIDRAQQQSATSLLEKKRLLQERDRMSVLVRDKESQVSKAKRHLDELNAREVSFAEEHEICRTTGWLASKSIYALLAQTERLQDEIAHCEGATEIQVAQKLSMVSKVEQARMEREVWCTRVEEKGRVFDSHTKQLQAGMDRIEKLTGDLLVKEQSIQKLMCGRTEEDVGPMEATIANLKAEVADKEAQAMEIQRQWRNWQSMLLSHEDELNKISDNLHSLNEGKRKLTRTRRTLEANLQELNRAVRGRADECAGHRQQVLRLGEGVQKAKEERQQLDKAIKILRLNMQSFFDEGSSSLQEMDSKLESSRALLEELRKRSILEESKLIELEREISIEKETQQVVLPLLKRSANEAVQKEVRKLRSDLHNAQKLQSKLWTDLQLQISKRGAMAATHQGTWTKGHAEKQNLSLQRQEENLDRKMDETQRALRVAKSSASRLDSERLQLRRSIDYAVETMHRQSERMDETHSEIESLKRKKRLFVARTLTVQHLHKSALRRLEGSESSSWRSGPPQASPGALEAHARVSSVHKQLVSLHESLPRPMNAPLHDATLVLRFAIAMHPDAISH